MVFQIIALLSLKISRKKKRTKIVTVRRTIATYYKNSVSDLVNLHKKFTFFFLQNIIAVSCVCGLCHLVHVATINFTTEEDSKEFRQYSQLVKVICSCF
jgi:hypothetical protein